VNIEALRFEHQFDAPSDSVVVFDQEYAHLSRSGLNFNPRGRSSRELLESVAIWYIFREGQPDKAMAKLHRNPRNEI
jgi:hypothetical protein